MNTFHFMSKLGRIFSLFCFVTSIHAGIPVWEFTPDDFFPPHLILNSTDTAIVKYIVTNNSERLHNLVLKPQTGVSQNGPCALGPRYSDTAFCILTLTITGSVLSPNGFSGGPVLCQMNPDGQPNPNQCYQPNKTNSLSVRMVSNAPILSVSTESLALSITGLILDSVASGTPRIITLTNIGDTDAVGVSIASSGLPTGTTVDSSGCPANLVAGGSCQIVVIPGATATEGANGLPCTNALEPVPGIVSATATNAINSTSTDIVVLGYACIYKGGYIYAMTETSETSRSISGKVASLTDQQAPSPGVKWSTNGFNRDSYDLLPGIKEGSKSNAGTPTYDQFYTWFTRTYPALPVLPSSAFQECDGNLNGFCNTRNILVFYNQYITGVPASNPPLATPLIQYAAGHCGLGISIDNYRGWYLPSICEMGPSSECAAGVQNMNNNLPMLLGTTSSNCTLGANCLAGSYWSSTEAPVIPDQRAGRFYFAPGGGFKYPEYKGARFGVRCSRVFNR